MRRPIRIMHVVDGLGNGGLENGLVNLINRLDPERFEHVVCTIRNLGVNEGRLPRERVPVICLGKKEGDSAVQIPALVRARAMTARLARDPYFHNPELPARLHRITCPTLIVWGDHDGMVPLELGRAYHAGIPGSRLLIMKNCGHVPPIERPTEFAAAAAAFLCA